MRRFWTLTLTAILLLSACGPSSRNQPASTGTPGLLPASSCGNGICEAGENSSSCLQDCPTTAFSGRVTTTFIKSDGGTGNIAVMVASPKTKRYPEGAGIVVVIPPIFSEADGFMRDPDLTSLGLIQVSYLWPGKADSKSGVESGGTFDYGGENSIKILRDVIRFAGGRLADTNGRYIFGLASVPPLSEEVGLYAFGDAGIAGVNALSLYGDQLQGLQYYVGRENSTVDTISSMEIGYYNDTGLPVYNPFYLYPASYSFSSLTLIYTNLLWESTYTSSRSSAVGRPYLDLDGNATISAGDYVFDGQTPTISGKRYYSTALTQALLDNGVLTLDGWPKDVATSQEAAQFWQIRQNPGQNPDRFADMQKDTLLQNLKVMLVFAQDDHAQVAQDKPHIHQAYQGFRFEARLWVRLNPDRVYVQSMMPGDRLDFPDNPANTQPDDWAKIGDYAYPGQGVAGRLVPLAAVAEMADRAHAGFWDENLGQVLYIYTLPTLQP